MRTIVLTTVAAVAALTAAPALAEGPKSATTEVTATVARDCTASSGSSIAISGSAAGTTANGTFTYSCNFTGAPSISIASLNGGLKSGGVDGRTVDYGVYLNDNAPTTAPNAWAQASTLTTAQTFDNITTTTAPNTPTTPSFAVGLSSALLVAGNYSDTLTITIAP